MDVSDSRIQNRGVADSWRYDVSPPRFPRCIKPTSRSPIVAGLLILGCLASIGPSTTSGQSTDALSRFTGAPTRIAWVQDTSRGAQDVQAQGNELLLMGYDSVDGQGERELLPTKGNYARPLFSDDGRQVIYTDRGRGRVMVLEWGSQKPRVLARGAALCSWRDPATKTSWVVIGRRVGQAGSYFYRGLVRVRLDNASISKPIWSTTRVSPDNFQLSRNGRFAAGVFPWPNGGLATLDPPTLSHLGKGCWASLAPDDSRLAWIFDGPHRHLRISAPDDGPQWKVAVDKVVGLARSGANTATAGGSEMFHPRWSNHVDFLVMTGPYNRKGPINVISGGGRQVEIYLGKFSKDFRTIAAATRISNNNRPDFFPDAWIASGPGSNVPASVLVAPQPTATTPSPWPPTVPGLAWAFQNTRRPVRLPVTEKRPGITCRLKQTGRTRPGRFFELRLSRGSASIEPPLPHLVPHWNSRHTLTLTLLLTMGPGESSRPGTLLAIQPPATAGRPTSRQRLALVTVPGKSGDGVSLSLATNDDLASATPLATLGSDVPAHLVIALDKQGARVRVNGQPGRQIPLPLDQLRLLPTSRPIWGNNTAGPVASDARISHVTLSVTALTDSQSQPLCDAATRIMKQRSPGRRAVVQARCVETSPVPTPAQIAPYRRALVYHHYRIDRVEKGRMAHRDILVGHWAILDGKVQPGRRPAIGRPIRLAIEPLEDHAQLDSERQVMEVERIELPQYIDVQ